MILAWRSYFTACIAILQSLQSTTMVTVPFSKQLYLGSNGLRPLHQQVSGILWQYQHAPQRSTVSQCKFAFAPVVMPIIMDYASAVTVASSRCLRRSKLPLQGSISQPTISKIYPFDRSKSAFASGTAVHRWANPKASPHPSDTVLSSIANQWLLMSGLCGSRGPGCTNRKHFTVPPLPPQGACYYIYLIPSIGCYAITEYHGINVVPQSHPGDSATPFPRQHVRRTGKGVERERTRGEREARGCGNGEEE